MDWDVLFDDLQGRLEAAERDEVDEQLADLVEAEAATMGFLDRLRAAVGSRLRVALSTGRALEATLVDCGVDWLLLAADGRQVLLPLNAVRWVAGLSGSAPEPGIVTSTLGLAHAFRALARERVDVVVEVTGGAVLRGVVGRVGRDHLDVIHTAGVATVPYAALVTVATA